MPDEFVGMEIATLVVTASIVLAGILIGIGRGFAYKRLEAFGLEELVQSVINAAIIGGFAAIVALVNEISASIVEDTCGTGSVLEQTICVMETNSISLFSMFQETVKLTNTLGYYQSLTLDFGFLAVQPFVNLDTMSSLFSLQVILIQSLIVLVELNVQIMSFIGENALLLLFPIGLVLRTFFVTRKVGGFLIGLSIGLYLLYPSFIMIFPDPVEEVDAAAANITAFNDKAYYSAAPVIDLNDDYALAGKLDVMSGRCFESDTPECVAEVSGLEREDVDFIGDITMIAQQNSTAIAKVLLYLILAPLFSLIVTIIFVKEMTRVLGGEIGLGTFKSI